MHKLTLLKKYEGKTSFVIYFNKKNVVTFHLRTIEKIKWKINDIFVFPSL